MRTEQKIIKTKVGVLELAKQLGNVSEACKVMGYSRDSFDRFPAAKRPCVRSAGASRTCANRVRGELEDVIVALAIEQPAWGQLRVANE